MKGESIDENAKEYGELSEALKEWKSEDKKKENGRALTTYKFGLTKRDKFDLAKK